MHPPTGPCYDHSQAFDGSLSALTLRRVRARQVRYAVEMLGNGSGSLQILLATLAAPLD